MAGVSQTAAGAVSQGGPNSENTLVASESSIWSIGEGGELNAVWINKDSSEPDALSSRNRPLY